MHRRFLAALLLLALLAPPAAAVDCPNDCSGHGTCGALTKQCTCNDGWGSDSDIALYKSADCSTRVCPAGAAWVDVATSATAAHADAECSNAGLCDRSTGLCACFPGYSGDACQRRDCPNDCSGHGRCLSMKELATEDTALPLTAADTSYTGFESTTTWDENKIFGCVCDSSWDVGLDSGETQEPEYFGPDCSLRHCPSGDDPSTAAVETNCQGENGGAAGNLCQVDCSNRGICNYQTGICDCFSGYTGLACGTVDALAT
eukprot:PLAT15607.1.p1 GENE.PLAT15607.1~~PLAT15607.1.p1  ORF type:complete len:260 (+),score=93.18 PLAT15607.1:34-813(+)